MVYFLVLSCETCPFVFSFCLPFSLKLSEAVTYADHEGMSFWGSSSVQSVCAPWLGGRASAVWSGRHCPVRGRLWPKEVKQEPWEHRAPPRFDGSLLPGLGPCWGVRSCSCTSQVVLVVKNPPANATDKKHGFNPWVRKIPWRRAWQPTLVFLPAEFMDRGAWRAVVHSITKSWTRLKQLRVNSDMPIRISIPGTSQQLSSKLLGGSSTYKLESDVSVGHLRRIPASIYFR